MTQKSYYSSFIILYCILNHMQVQLQYADQDPVMRVVRAARNDYETEWVGNMRDEEVIERMDTGNSAQNKIENLIEHLLDQGHFGPFEHPHATFSVEGVSRSLMAQITRHRHVSFDIQSMRYVDFQNRSPGDLTVTPASVENFDASNRDPDMATLDDIRDNGIVSDDAGKLEVENERQKTYRNAIEYAATCYNELRELGVPPEDARFVLPIGTKVNMVFTLNARMLMHVADMRAAADAQWEIREMTERILDLAAEWFPECFSYYEASMKNRKNRLAP